MKCIHLLKPLWIALTLLLPILGISSATAYSQEASRTFPETGHTVQGKFLQYWQANGGLDQQGYPISEEMQEISATDGKTYTVQYFERAVFELHPENAGTPYEVLLQLLGVFFYQQRYPNGAPNQQPNNDVGSQAFSQTGKRLGGLFLNYWQSHGAVTQQGFPISDEFSEVSPLDGKTYTVQYFERAVFELHPENAGTPYEVLLSQLGTFQYKDRYLQPSPTATAALNAIPTTTTQPTSPPTTIAPAPIASPQPVMDCSDIPDNVNAGVSPNCVTPGDQEITVTIQAFGFTPGEQIALRTEDPCCQPSVIDPYPRKVDSKGGFQLRYLIQPHTPDYGLTKTTFTGKQSGHVAIAYFKVIPPR